MASNADFANLMALLRPHAAAWGPDRERRLLATLLARREFVPDVNFDDNGRFNPVQRRASAPLQLAFLMDFLPGHLKHGQWASHLCPCEVCCLPTGSWCEGCDNCHAAVCSICDSAGAVCRECSQNNIAQPAERIFVPELTIYAVPSDLLG